MTAAGRPRFGLYSPLQPCKQVRAGLEYCGATPTRPYLFGARCGDHAPATPVPDPARSMVALLELARQRREQGRPRRFYDGSPGRQTVICPDCGEPADARLGRHMLSGNCYSRFDAAGNIRTDLEPGQYQLACMEIRRAALARPVFSANHTRVFMDSRHIPVKVRQRAFRDLLGTVMEQLDYEESIEPTRIAGKPRRVRTYRSLIHQPAAAPRELVSR